MPVITVAACSSVPAYSSSTFSGPSQSIQACLSHGGHGAARWKATCREETSAAGRTASGRRQMRSIMVGTRNSQFTRCFSISRSVWAGSNRGTAAATVIAVTWPTAATSRSLSPPKMLPTTTSSARSSAAAARASHEPYSRATAIAAVASRGGRPDLARPRLAAVTAPTLLIVGGDDEVVLDLNRRVKAELRCENHLAIVPGAGHLFEEPGTLAAAAALARDWFVSHLARSRDPVA